MISKELTQKILNGMGRYAVMKELNIGESRARRIINEVRSGVVAPAKVSKPKAAKPTVGSVKVKTGIKKIDAPKFDSKADKPKKVAKVKKPAQFTWLVGSTTASITLNGKPYVVGKTHEHFKEICQLCFDDTESSILKAVALTDVKVGLNAYSQGKVRIDENENVFYGDIQMDSSLTQRIVVNMRANKPFSHLVNFFENLMLNPSKRAVQELFGFLKANDIELTEDGCFIAWKRVDSDYKDLYTHTMDNSVGKRVEMSRDKVVDNSEITCAAGLHVCSKSYLKHYYGGTGVIIACKVHPKDVVSIPVDYDNAKMRCAGYDVVSDVTATIGIE